MSMHCDSDLLFEYLESEAALADGLPVPEILDNLALEDEQSASLPSLGNFASTKIPTTKDTIPPVGDKKSDRNSLRQE